MGIVVTLALFLASLYFCFQPEWYRKYLAQISLFVGLMGLWNFFWFGLRHLTVFWGLAALVSGLVLMISSIYIYPKVLGKFSMLDSIFFKRIIAILAALCFALYAITIIQINLGLPIIR